MSRECKNCLMLEKELAQARYELAQARERAATATDLMMKGEALRERAMLGAILAGDTEQKKANLVYILTGKRL